MSTELYVSPAAAAATTPRQKAPLALPRRLLGCVLVALPLLPLYRLLDHPRTGLAGQSTVQSMIVYGDFIGSGLLLVLLIAVLAAMLPLDIAGSARALLLSVRRLGDVRLALLLALVSAALTLMFTLLVLEGKPNAIDSLAQILHARFWAEGRMAGPTEGGEFWTLQNAVFTTRGWVSQYPPGHVAILALAFALGVLPLTGAVLVGVTVFFGALIALRLYADDPVTARFGAALLALCPFLIMLGGSYMNHVTAAAFVTIGAYALLRAWQGRSDWALVAGVAFSYALCTRPLSTMAMAAALAVTLPFVLPERPSVRRFVVVNLKAVAGAAPLLLAFLAYNRHFFGHPLRMGYDVALGPAMRLGFHRDPWGNTYGLRESLAWTAVDLRALSVNLFETPLPAVVLAGLFLLIAPRIRPATRVLAAWALLPVASNALYWHHGLFMGPRLLHEAAPAWALLLAVSFVGLLRMCPPDMRLANRFRVRNGAAGAVAFSLMVGLLYLAPQRALTYGGHWLDIMRVAVPQTPEPTLVFVHDAWIGRIGMTLAAHGFRLDQVETVLRQNATCDADRLAQLAARGDVAGARAFYATLDTVPRSDRLPLLVAIAPGDHVRMWPGERFTAECERQARSDRFGILDVAPLTWQGDLPGGPARHALFVRDLGPARNAGMLSRYTDRKPLLYAYVEGSDVPRLLPYVEGMTLLWGTAQ